MVTMGKVEASYVHAGVQHLNNGVYIITRRTNSANDISLPFIHVELFENLSIFNLFSAFWYVCLDLRLHVLLRYLKSDVESGCYLFLNAYGLILHELENITH